VNSGVPFECAFCDAVLVPFYILRVFYFPPKLVNLCLKYIVFAINAQKAKTETERQKDIGTGVRQREGETERQIKTCIQRNRETERHERQVYKETERPRETERLFSQTCKFLLKIIDTLLSN
jgi:hypothetical protein